MNILIKQILDSNQKGLEDTINSNPELLNVKSESNRTPLEVAKATENTYIFVTLLRRSNQTPEIDQDWFILLKEYISQISNDWLCSTWNSGIEYHIWHALQGNIFKVYGSVEHEDLSVEIRKDLEYLSSRINGWVTYEENHVIPIEEWKIRYSEWLQS
jgi:hypothetical protein